jgi:pimeloyl-ACP methyl ester carboxylesterase
MQDPRLFHRDEGQGPPVLLVHGLASHTQVFDDLMAQGAGKYRFVAVDLPRSGKSKEWAASAPGAIADALVPWLEEKGLRQFAVVGHSFGGLVALELAARRPKAVTKLVVASAPALGLPPQAKQLLTNPVSDVAMQFLSRLPAYRPAIRRYFEWLWGEPKRLTERHIDIYAAALEADGVWHGMLEAARAIAQWRLPIDALREAAIGTHILWGEKDPLVPLVHGEHLATSLQAPFTVLEKTGHCVPEERPEAILKALG